MKEKALVKAQRGESRKALVKAAKSTPRGMAAWSQKSIVTRGRSRRGEIVYQQSKS